MIFELLLSFSLICASFCDVKRYENYTLFRGLPIKDVHLEFLRNLSDAYDVNYWRIPGSLRMPVDFVISPNDLESFLKEANKTGVFLTTIMEDIQSAFDKQTVKTYSRKNMDSFDWHHFYRTRDIYDWLNDLVMVFPLEVHVFSIGKSYEGRDILAVKLVLSGSLRRSKVIIEGGIHAREWISPAFVTYLLQQVLYSKSSPDKELRHIAMMYEWYFVPVLNPDGYEYTFDHDRQWRKNRHGSGVDLNRNFGFGFGTEGVSSIPKAETYCGVKAFSEPESAAMAQFVKSKSPGLEYYFSFHAYGQYMIIPYAHSTSHVENYAEMRDMGLKAAERIRSFYNKKYKVGTAYDTVGYKVSGASTCWVKKTFGVPYAMTFELRDEGSYGFALPPHQILPTCIETLAGVLSLLTPNKEYKKLKHSFDINGGKAMYLVKILIVFNVILFIKIKV